MRIVNNYPGINIEKTTSNLMENTLRPQSSVGPSLNSNYKRQMSTGTFTNSNLIRQTSAGPSLSSNAQARLQRSGSYLKRLMRQISLPTLPIHRYIQKLRTGSLMLELDSNSDWKQYTIVLGGSAMTDLGLYYYTNASDTAPLGCIHLNNAQLDVLDEIIMVTTKTRTWFLCADNKQEAMEWSQAISSAIERVSQNHLLGCEKSTKRWKLPSYTSKTTLKDIHSRSPSSRVNEFLEVFVQSTANDIGLQVTKGTFSSSCIRGIAWRIWLGVLPVASTYVEWYDIARIKRHRYEEMLRQHISSVDYFNLESQGIAEESLLSCESSTDSLLYSIYKDVRRTRATMPFFQQVSTQWLLMRVLYAFSKAHPEISYNQGMSEILATIVYLIHVEQWPTAYLYSSKSHSISEKEVDATSPMSVDSVGPDQDPLLTPRSRTSTASCSEEDTDHLAFMEDSTSLTPNPSLLDRSSFLQSCPFSGHIGKIDDSCRSEASSLISEITSGKYIEHDAFLLFEEVMLRMVSIYCPEQGPSYPTSQPTKSTACSFEEQLDNILNTLLSQCDNKTAKHISALKIDPQHCLLRWVRVLMCREFDLPQVWHIWDVIFRFTPTDFSFIDILCVAAIGEYQAEIIQAVEKYDCDPTTVLLCMKQLSERIDARRLVEKAKRLYDDYIVTSPIPKASTY